MTEGLLSYGIWVLVAAFGGILAWPVDLYHGSADRRTASRHRPWRPDHS